MVDLEEEHEVVRADLGVDSQLEGCAVREVEGGGTDGGTKVWKWAGTVLYGVLVVAARRVPV